MANFGKWLGGTVGFTLGGPIGAIIGYAIGSFVDGFSSSDFRLEQGEYERKVEEEYRRAQQRQRESGRWNRTQRPRQQASSGDFEISLLILASLVIKADGKVDQVELDYVRKHFLQMYGKDRANKAFKLFNGIIKRQVSARQVCMQIREHMSHSARLQLIHFLFGIAKADGTVTASEEEEIQKLANYLYINGRDYASIKAMFYDEVDSAYKMLEITKNATNDEVKKAYRKMAKKYHPDRLQNVGEEHKKGAKEKFQRIQAAYEKIKVERGF